MLPADIKHRGMQWLDTSLFSQHIQRAPAADGIQLWLWRDTVSTPAGAAEKARERLRRTLAGQLGIDEETLRFSKGLHGKPALDLPGMPHFNLSHSGSVTALALGMVEVGVDVEQPRRTRDVMALAERYFARAETNALARLAKSDQEAAFYSLWTCKEAVLKALGRGIAFGLDRLEFELDPRDGRPVALTRIADEAGAAAEWQVCRFEPIPRGAGALAWRGPAVSVCGFLGKD